MRSSWAVIFWVRCAHLHDVSRPRVTQPCCAVGNFSLTDWGVFGGLSAISYPLGYAAGASPSPAFAKVSGNMARPSAGMAAILGAIAGFMLAYQNSSGRLMGFKPNDAEVQAAKR